MSIEISTAAPVAPRPDKGPSKTKAVGDEVGSQPGADLTPFAAVLASLDGASAGLGPAPAGELALTEGTPISAPMDPTMLLAQGQGLVPPSDGVAKLAANVPSLEVQLQQTRAAAAPRLDAEGSAGAYTDVTRSHSPGIQARGSGADVDPESEAGTLSNAMATETSSLQVPRRRTDPMRRDARSDASAPDAVSRSRTESAQLADAGKTDWRAALAAQADRVAGSGAALTELAGGAFRSLTGMRSSDRSPSGSVLMPLDSGAGFTAPAQGVGGSASAGTPLVASADAPPLVGASSEIAQKVHYWVTRGVQNAELQLDGFDGGSVDVSISLQGDRATVEFRTDESEARRLLQDAMPQLRDMLRAEGLELSSGSVATSTQRDAQPGQPGPGGGGKSRAAKSMTSEFPEEKAARPVTSRVHALDVFV